MQLVRYRSSTGSMHTAVMVNDRISGHLTMSLHELLRLRTSDLRNVVERARQGSAAEQEAIELLAPVDGTTEVWAAGVTYKRSVDARVEESETPDIYTRVYTAPRPELFFKGVGHRIAAPGTAISIRADSTWNVPEPELALVVNTYGEIVGYTIANDVSSRSIEGENPLYLPQAKVYLGSCALGPGITPAWEVNNAYALTMHMQIERDHTIFWQGQTTTGELHRRLEELVEYLYREDDFPDGAILCTGTALVPEQPFTLQANDIVQIRIDLLGTLRNSVVQGKQAFKEVHHYTS
jgi:2-dehydro-3-deoxy-D-arabinonate dehydratase